VLDRAGSTVPARAAYSVAGYRNSLYQLNLSASCIFLGIPAASTGPKLLAMRVRQASPLAVRNGTLKKMLYISARNWSFQGPEPHGPVSASSKSLKNDQSKLVKLFMRTLLRPTCHHFPTGRLWARVAVRNTQRELRVAFSRWETAYNKGNFYRDIRILSEMQRNGSSNL
jgi:hypothetical protein